MSIISQKWDTIVDWIVPCAICGEHGHDIGGTWQIGPDEKSPWTCSDCWDAAFRTWIADYEPPRSPTGRLMGANPADQLDEIRTIFRSMVKLKAGV